MYRTRRIVKNLTFDLTGAGTTDVNLTAHDLSGVEELQIEARLTTAATDSGDGIDIKLQETLDGIYYNTRARLASWAGNLTVSATAPEVLRMQILSRPGLLDPTEQSYEPTGSAGATELSAGSVKNGSLVGFYRSAAGRQPGMRLRFIVTDAGTVNAHFAGTIDLWALSRC